jgi:hypothetical protein
MLHKFYDRTYEEVRAEALQVGEGEQAPKLLEVLGQAVAEARPVLVLPTAEEPPELLVDLAASVLRP